MMHSTKLIQKFAHGVLGFWGFGVPNEIDILNFQHMLLF